MANGHRAGSLANSLRLPNSDVNARPNTDRGTLFDHLPKTAGTSVIAALECGLSQSGGLSEVPCPHHVAVRRAGTRRFLAGHLWFFPGESLAPGWFYATILRDPIDRFLSQYYFYRSQRVVTGNPDVLAAQSCTLPEFLANARLDHLSTNFQARHFAMRMSEAPERLSEQELFEAAVASLREYDLVGVFADVQGFVDAYCDGIGIPRQLVPHVNATALRPSLHEAPESVLELLRERNAVDLALCTWAREQLLMQRRQGAQPRRVFRLVQDRSVADFGSRRIMIVSSYCEASNGSPRMSSANEIRVTLRGHSSVNEDALTVGIAVRNARGELVHATNTHILGVPVRVSAHLPFQWAFTVPPLPAGAYSVTLALHKGPTHLDGCYHWLDDAASFVVHA